MTPDTVHLVAQLIRHSRGIGSAWEKWIKAQPYNPTCRELLQVLAVYRAQLTELEDKVSKFEVDSQYSLKS